MSPKPHVSVPAAAAPAPALKPIVSHVTPAGTHMPTSPPVHSHPAPASKNTDLQAKVNHSVAEDYKLNKTLLSSDTQSAFMKFVNEEKKKALLKPKPVTVI